LPSGDRKLMPPLSLELLVLVLIMALGLTFDFINGFHDTANAIATVVATRVLSPGRAVLMAGVLNFVGALSGTAVATTVGKGIIPPELSTQTLVVSALIAAITWNLVTWYFGLPSSSSHALIFSLVGAGVATNGWSAIQFGGLEKTFQGLVFSPVLGFASAFLLMVLLLNLFAQAFPATVTRVFGRAQLLSAAYMAFSHGSNDAQKTMGVMTMALASYLHWGGTDWQVPLWIIVAAALAMGLGTSIGGWRIIRTIGLRVVQLRPIHGFAAETAAATVIEAASRLGVPVSTTHTIGSAILGVGSTRRLSAVRWGIAGQIVMAWVFTIPACFLLAWFVRTILALAGA
jgi:inorganic phosphate transporter, PiT family